MIRFTVTAPSRIGLDVFNVRREWVASIFDRYVTAGNYETRWNGRDSNGLALASGVYFLRGRMGEVIAWQRMLLLR
jgi:hypothetical protein